MNIMLHTEVVECLRPLDDETLASIMRMIFDWNDGIEVNPISQVEKFAWALVLPKLERNKITYETKVKQTTAAANKRWNKQTDTNEYERMREDTNYNSNYNSNNNTSKDVLLSGGTEQDETLEGVSLVEEEVVSKGLETLEKTFPERKRAIGVGEINLWNSISQPQKSNLIKMAKVYIRNEQKNENGKYIKQLSKWMKEQVDAGIPEEIKKPVKKQKRLFEMTNAVMWNEISNFGFSNSQTDIIYQTLNSNLESKEEFVTLIKTSTKEDLSTILN